VIDRTRALRAAGLLAAASLLCAGCSLLPSRPASPAAPVPRPGTARPAGPASPAQARVPSLSTLLPFSSARLQAAAALATRFAAACQTWSWQQQPAAWLAGLQPMTTPSLYGELAQAAVIPGVLAQRNATRQAATAIASAAQIRDLTVGSVTVVVAVSQVITSTRGTTQATASLAVTLTPQGSGWVVWDVEPASAGNS
jgi:hypothetical protein